MEASSNHLILNQSVSPRYVLHIFFITRDAIEKAFFKSSPFSYIRHTLITLVMVLSTAIIGCVVCDLGVVLEITGGVFASVIAFLVPSMCWLQGNKIKETNLSFSQKLPHFVCISFGIFLMIMTVVMTILEQLKHKEGAQCVW